jgi:hypothetical protein
MGRCGPTRRGGCGTTFVLVVEDLGCARRLASGTQAGTAFQSSVRPHVALAPATSTRTGWLLGRIARTAAWDDGAA